MNLDHLEEYTRLDPSGMGIDRQPGRAVRRRAQARRRFCPARYGEISQVVILGMGGSAIAGIWCGS